MTDKVRRVLNRGLTVAELIESLRGLPPTARVVFGCDYGDRGHTEQAIPVTSVADLADERAVLAETGYSASGLCVRELDGENDPESDDPGPWASQVVILR